MARPPPSSKGRVVSALWAIVRVVSEHQDQTAILRAMTPAQRLAVGTRLYWAARRLKEAALRARHPAWTEEQIKAAAREAFLYGRG